MPWTISADILSSLSGIYSSTYHLRKPEVWCICYTLFSHVVDTAGVTILRGREWSREMVNEESNDTQLVRIGIKTGLKMFSLLIQALSAILCTSEICIRGPLLLNEYDYQEIPWMFKTKEPLFSPNQLHPLCSSLPSSSLFGSTRKLHCSCINPLGQSNEIQADALLPLFPPSNPFCTTWPV